MRRLPVIVAAVLVLALVAAVAAVFTTGSTTRTVTAHFQRAVSVYKGTEVRVMGVKIGQVTAVVPEGDSVRVVMQYDDTYKIPAGAKAAIVTPTLVADRFVQLAPAYTRGPVMRDHADIKTADTGTPVELDRIYRSLSMLTQALGPNGANKDGSLDQLLAAGDKALAGNGALGNQTIRDFSGAVQTFGDNRGPLFDSVSQLSAVTQTLAQNNQVVDEFMGDLTSASAVLAGERGNLQAALAALARALGTVKDFVRGNRGALIKNIKSLSGNLRVLAKEKDSLDTSTRLSALGLENLTIAFDHKVGSIGSRVQFGPTGQNLGNALCDMAQNSGVSDPELACTVLKAIAAPLSKGSSIGAGNTSGGSARLGGSVPASTLNQLLGGA